jgi:hypothetical protein
MKHTVNLNPDNCCPICGRGLNQGHRCSAKDLARLDAASQTDPNMGIVRTLPVGSRISEGFRLMRMSGD